MVFERLESVLAETCAHCDLWCALQPRPSRYLLSSDVGANESRGEHGSGGYLSETYFGTLSFLLIIVTELGLLGARARDDTLGFTFLLHEETGGAG